jgi:hypothetical protein
MSDNLSLPDEGIAPDSKIAKGIGVHPKTLPRWDKRAELGFPAPIYINGRKFRSWSAVKEFLRHAALEHASKLTFKRT